MVMETLLITQARVSSTRLPGKVLKTIGEKSLLEIQLNRLAKCKEVSKILVATTTNPADSKISQEAERLQFSCFEGSELDVLDRYYQAAKSYNPKWVVRVTSDCPLLDPILVDKVIKFAKSKGLDYVSNILVEEFPDGQDVEVMKFTALEKAWKLAIKKSDREHVTLFIRNNCDVNNGVLFSADNFPAPGDFSKIRMTVDEQNDFDLIEKLIESIGSDRTWEEYTGYINDKGLGSINGSIIRNEGLLKSLKKES